VYYVMKVQWMGMNSKSAQHIAEAGNGAVNYQYRLAVIRSLLTNRQYVPIIIVALFAGVDKALCNAKAAGRNMFVAV